MEWETNWGNVEWCQGAVRWSLASTGELWNGAGELWDRTEELLYGTWTWRAMGQVCGLVEL